jgi:8-oxo-dGTP pyrophosphatase MutT (NUDIX family)
MNRIERISRNTLVENQWIALHEDTTKRQERLGKYYVVDRANTVIIAIVDVADQLLLVEQFRYPTNEVSLELPMGGIDPGESCFDAAVRELQEETGIAVRSVHECASFRPVPGLSAQRAHVLLARYDMNFASGPSLSTASHIEDDIRGIRIVPVREIGRMISRSAITDGFTLSALMILVAADQIQIDGM